MSRSEREFYFVVPQIFFPHLLAYPGAGMHRDTHARTRFPSISIRVYACVYKCVCEAGKAATGGKRIKETTVDKRGSGEQEERREPER